MTTHTHSRPPYDTQRYIYSYDTQPISVQDIQAYTPQPAANPTPAQTPYSCAQEILSYLEEMEDSAQSPSVWKELASLAIKIASICVAFILIFTFFYGFHRSIDPDMMPMLQSGDLVIFYRLGKDYAIGDLLLLEFQGERQVRRVVARAGDTVDFKEGELIVNGAMQQEPDIFQESWSYEDGASFPLSVGEGQVFVLGDARENAADSRVYGPVNIKDSLGTVITVIRRRNP